MRAVGFLGLALVVLGLVVALLSLGTRCYAQVIPGLPPEGLSCDQTAWIAAGGMVVFLLGVVLLVRSTRVPRGPHAP